MQADFSSPFFNLRLLRGAFDRLSYLVSYRQLSLAYFRKATHGLNTRDIRMSIVIDSESYAVLDKEYIHVNPASLRVRSNLLLSVLRPSPIFKETGPALQTEPQHCYLQYGYNHIFQWLRHRCYHDLSLKQGPRSLGNAFIGSNALTQVQSCIRPPLAVYGHVHEQRGLESPGGLACRLGWL